MTRQIKCMEDKYLLPSLELVERVFTAHENEQEGKLVQGIIKIYQTGSSERKDGEIFCPLTPIQRLLITLPN